MLPSGAGAPLYWCFDWAPYVLACFLFPQVADPTYLLPALAGLSFLATVELGAADGMEGQVRCARVGRTGSWAAHGIVRGPALQCVARAHAVAWRADAGRRPVHFPARGPPPAAAAGRALSYRVILPVAQPEGTKKKMKNAMRVVALAVPLLSTTLPASVFMYWTGEAP